MLHTSEATSEKAMSCLLCFHGVLILGKVKCHVRNLTILEITMLEMPCVGNKAALLSSQPVVSSCVSDVLTCQAFNICSLSQHLTITMRETPSENYKLSPSLFPDPLNNEGNKMVILSYTVWGQFVTG